MPQWKNGENAICNVPVDNEKAGAENELRIFEMCKNCREKCRTDRAFERYATEKAFKLKLGRRIKKK